MASVKTVKGREKQAKALAGDKALPKVTHLAFGSGGTDSNGNIKALSGNETSLFSEVIRKTVGRSYPISTTIRFSATLNADLDSLVGTKINEACLIDSEGDVVAIKTFSDKGLDMGDILEFDYDGEF